MRFHHVILAGVSALAVLVGLQPAWAQTPELPVAPLTEIEKTYDTAGSTPPANPPAASMQDLERAIQEEVDARGGKPTAAAPKPITAGLLKAVPQTDTPGRASPRAAGVTAAAARPATTAKTEPTVELPAVPSSVVAPTAAQATEDLSLLSQPTVITVRPGTTELLAVAEGHLNRFVTPFAEPAVITTSDAKYKVSGNVVYVSTTAPATIFISPKGDDSVAIPLALVPRRIPPREIRLEAPKEGFWKASFGGPAPTNTKAKTWEESQPYVETIRGLMRDLALGNVPSGYQMRETDRGEQLARCKGPASVAFRFDAGQVLEGSHLQVVVGVVANTGGQPVELAEPWCAGPDVAAVAYWPSNMLNPGQSAEVFVVRRPVDPSAADNRRPSLLQRAGAGR